MTKICTACGWWINLENGEWVDEDNIAECYDEDNNYVGQHTPEFPIEPLSLT